jgi:hypothetical protein
MDKVWTWKNQLPATYLDQIFYDKIKGGRAVPCSCMAKLREFYPQQHTPLSACSALAQARSQFDRALQELQVTFNIARSNRPDVEGDTWVPFLEQYPAFADS